MLLQASLVISCKPEGSDGKAGATPRTRSNEVGHLQIYTRVQISIEITSIYIKSRDIPYKYAPLKYKSSNMIIRILNESHFRT
jgi:hypothetical protein